jgi:hypothetical protein
MNLSAPKKSATKAPRNADTKPAGKTGPKANASRATQPNAKPAAEASPVNGAAAAAGKVVEETIDSTAPQFSSLVSKVIELADVGVKLGINVVSLLANYAQNQAGNAAPGPQQAAPAVEPQPASGNAPDPGPARNYCIVNRMPLHSGDAVKVSFSINNDMRDSAKNLVLSCDGFTGATQAFAIPHPAFSVEPASASIGPLDFERFVLKGAIPGEAPADSYNGWILVAGDEQMRIPVVLMVT